MVVNLKRRAVLAATVAAPAVFTAGAARAQLPRPPIRLVVSAGPGSGSDVVTRIVAQRAGEILDKPFVVENRPAGVGVVAIQSVLAGPKDGSNIVVASPTAMIIQPALNPQVTYRAEQDLVGVSGLSETAFAIVTREAPDAPKSIAELVARLATVDASYGSLGVGSFQHLIAESLLLNTKRHAIHVPYRGSPALLTGLLQGDLLFGVDSLAGTHSPIQSRQLRVLAVTSAKRIPSLPDVPTLSEALNIALVMKGWAAFFAPAGTPGAVCDLLGSTFLRALAEPAVAARFEAMSAYPMLVNGTALMERVKLETPLWMGIIRDANVKLEN
jgi:tripartite-type tricarboxylate transporter receptor subunit TctC